MVGINAKKIPKNNDEKTFTITELFKYKTTFVLKLYLINNLRISPKVLPNKILIIDPKSKFYILIQPFVVLLGCSIN